MHTYYSTYLPIYFSIYLSIYLSISFSPAEYLDIVTEYPAWHMRTVRSHIMKFLFRYMQVFPEIRDAVATADEVVEFKKIVQVCMNCLSIYGEFFIQIFIS